MSGQTEIPHLEIGHIAFVVPHLDRAIRFLSTLGAEFSAPKTFGSRQKNTFQGEEQEWKVIFCTGKLGKLGLEVFQPQSEGTPYSEFLAKTGGGIHHISFDDIDDLEKELTDMESRGAKVISSASTKQGYAAHYLEAEAVPGVILEIKRK